MATTLQPFGVGSVPWRDPEPAVAHVFRYYSVAPFVPQLPLRGALSQMVVEPFQRYRAYLDGSRSGTIRKGALDELVALSALSPEHRLDAAPRNGAVDFDACLTVLARGAIPRCKLQLIGPATLFKHLTYGGHPLTEATERSAIYSLYLEELEYRLTQVRALTSVVSVVFDEPALPYLGRGELAAGVSQLARLSVFVRERGAQFGVHCCGPLTDPGVYSAVKSLQADIVSIPFLSPSSAVGEGDPEALTALVREGGTLALGVCPTDGSIAHFDPAIAVDQLRKLAHSRIELAVSASCGLAFSGEENAEAVGRMLQQVCELFPT